MVFLRMNREKKTKNNKKTTQNFGSAIQWMPISSATFTSETELRYERSLMMTIKRDGNLLPLLMPLLLLLLGKVDSIGAYVEYRSGYVCKVAVCI